MQRRLSALLAILALSLSATLSVGSVSAAASTPEPPAGTGDSQVEPPEGGDPGPGPGGSGGGDPCDQFTPEPCTGGEGGGGGGGGDVFGRPTAEEAARLIQATRVATRAALVNKPRCFNLLSQDDSRESGALNPITVLDTVPITYVNDNTFDFGYAVGSGVDGQIAILNGFFLVNFHPGLRFPGWIELSAYIDLPVIQLTVEDMRLIAMLHELGHLTRVNVHPAPEVSLSILWRSARSSTPRST